MESLIFEDGLTFIPRSICRGAESLTSVTIPDSVTEIGSSAFSGCKALTKFALPANVKSLGSYFLSGATGVKEIIVPKTVTDTKLNPDEDDNNSNNNCANAFNGSSVETLIFEDGSTFIPRSICNGAKSLTTVVIPEDVTEICSEAFRNCTELTNISFPSTLRRIDSSAFYDCKKLSSVIMQSNTEEDVLKYIGSSAFYNCSSLKSFSLPFADDITIETQAFYNCTLSGTCGDKLSWSYSIADATLSIEGSGTMTFDDAKAIPWKDFVGSIKYILFTDGILSIADNAFSDCINVNSVIIPDSVTSIGQNAFSGCTNLVRAEISSNIETIGAGAFENCSNLETMIFCGDLPSIPQDSIPTGENVTVYYPASSAEWKDYETKDTSTRNYITWNDSLPARDITLVLDCSGSMDGERIVSLKTAVKAFINKTGGRLSNTRIAIIAFDSSATVLNDFTTDITRLSSTTVNSLYANGGTEYTTALNSANNLLKSSKADIKSIIFFSDGEPNDSTSSIYPVAQSIRDQGYHLFTVGFCSAGSSYEDILINVAGSQDHYFSANDIDSLIAQFLQLNDDIQFIDLNNDTLTIPLGSTRQLSVSFKLADRSNVQWESSDSSIVTVSATGKVTAKAIGKATVTVKTKEEEYIASCEITVVDKIIPVESFKIRHHSVTMKAYERYQIYYNIIPWNATNRKLIWTSTNNSIAVVGDYGVITAKSNGTAEITLTTEDGGFSDKITVTVTGNDLEEMTTTVSYSIDGKKGKADLSLKSDWFSNDSIDYNHEMAQLCSKLMMLGYTDETTVQNALTGLGFDDSKISSKVTKIYLQQGRYSVNYYISSKEININGKIQNLVIAGFIGSHGEQWLDNFEPGYGDTHRGFSAASAEMLQILRNYCEDNRLDVNNTKIMIFGHSRGAAVANLVAANLIDTEDLAFAKNIYTYAFATPSYTKTSSAPAYQRIVNIINPEDFVPKVLPTAWGFSKFGQKYVLPSKTNDSNWNNYLSRLQKSYQKYKVNCDFPAAKNGDLNVFLAVLWLTSYLPTVNDFYKKNVVTFGKNIYKYFLPDSFVDKYYTKYGDKSFYQLLQESLLKPLAYSKNTFSFNFDQYYNEGKMTLFDFDNIAQFVFGELGGNLIDRLSYQYFDYKEFINHLDADDFVDNTTNHNIYYAIVMTYVDYLADYFSQFGLAHESQTYVAYMDALTEDEILQYRDQSLTYIRCPVDVEVVEKSSGEIVARIVNNEVDQEILDKENSLVAYVDGDNKVIVVPTNGEYDVVVIGNDDGTMDYTLVTLDDQGAEINRTNYFDVPVENNILMMEDFIETEDGNTHNAIVNEFGEEIGEARVVSSEDFNTITVRVTVEGIGYVFGAGNYTIGDYVTLAAFTDDNNSFLGFYDKEKLISNELTYAFIIKENQEITAKFTNNRIEAQDIKIDEGLKTSYDIEKEASEFSISASIFPSNTTDRRIIWTSSDESVATVTDYGIVTLHSGGTVTLTAATANGKLKDSVQITVNAHHLIKTDEKAATCTEAGNVEYYTCSVCKKIFSDARGTKEITDVTVKPLGHNYGAWTELNENEHQRVCANDASHVETAAHTWNKGKVTTKATCETDGVKTYTCTVCKAKKTEVIPATGHAYGDWTELNENEHQRVCANDASHVETAAHEWNEGKVVKEPAPGVEGEKRYVCKDCGAVKTEPIKAIPDETAVQPSESSTTETPSEPGTTVLPSETAPPETEPTTGEPVEKGFFLGDVNKDGKINAKDARAALRISARLDPADELTLKLADSNQNGKVQAGDARLILRHSAKLEKLPDVKIAAE